MQTSVPEPRNLFLRLLEIAAVSTRLGLTSFGGPVAHMGYYHEEYVRRRNWLDEHTYADLVALCQFLPGPASSQVGISIGIVRAGLLGGIVVWLGFTMPSAIALILFSYGVDAFGVAADAGWLHGLKVVAVAIVALAVWGMAKSLAPDKPRATMAIISAIAMISWSSTGLQVAVIVIAGLVGWRLFKEEQSVPTQRVNVPIGRKTAVVSLVLFGALLISLPLAQQVVQSEWLEVFNSFYRSGSLVFGGGHVVLPLLQAEVVPPGWVTNDQFIAGYGAAQAVPGPLFTFAAYLGAASSGTPNGWTGGLFALGAIFLPSFLLVTGTLPFWDRLRSMSGFRGAIQGINAAVVGLLLAALYSPVFTSAINAPRDLALALAAFGLLAFWKWPPWLVVILAALAGAGLALL
ncbi:MAG: chromate efflux transporter [Chloroflexi bacterium]|nr:chromate efflux transporter [Chloroflexota bacterium]